MLKQYAHWAVESIVVSGALHDGNWIFEQGIRRIYVADDLEQAARSLWPKAECHEAIGEGKPDFPKSECPNCGNDQPHVACVRLS